MGSAMPERPRSVTS
ncbi:hypothetical protein CVS29_16020 [Arthrobacter psychrochitiniphilus]|uniref:Uncharacterized protein n=1 Tax=Arthrobacter psychrochitiniphilus TaxID=291045 RepID=A0A2V3DNR4_9MICC|nr:hypothetical protein CVS29_16020 [Arthrobacter psychrochitiniphilus]